MKVLAVVQARMGSRRFPGKVLAPLGGRTVLEVLLSRLKRSNLISDIIVATSDLSENNPIESLADRMGLSCYRGEEKDVLSRFYNAVASEMPDLVVRVTGDCPLVSPQLADKLVQMAIEGNCDYCSNISPPTFPDGLDLEVMTHESLSLAYWNANSNYDREHVTPYIRRQQQLKSFNLTSERDYSDYRWTIDEPDDLLVLQTVLSHFNDDIYVDYRALLDLNNQKPHIFSGNAGFVRNEGSLQ